MEEIKTNTTTKSNDSPVQQKDVLKPLDLNDSNSKMNWSSKTVLIFILIAFFGTITGFAVYAKKTAGTVRLAGQNIEIVKTDNEEGVKDASTFRDTATGKLEENDGKITDEGTHILIRGDVSQNVYLTSSVVDLSKYVGKKVQVWGETFQGRKAGWLMDVGRIKVL